ncbi:uncharacterized protein LOC128221238 [Mya arenaria]|uniref:uncharacterized protein LOC128221238 n=1 Tax=Mya arenaria TaxID=6604 RepID=UPI0022DEFBBE|nr:uncharacterized protein LOC128221238 [Mya arenaria]
MSQCEQPATAANGDDEDDGPVTAKTNNPPPPNIPTTRSLFDARQSRIQEDRDTWIFVLLENQQEQLRQHTQLLRLILARGLAQDAVPNELPEGISFPLKTVVDLAAFKKRKSQANTPTSVVKYLAEYGGSDTVDTVSQIMKTVLTTNLARQYNLKGTKQKDKHLYSRMSTIEPCNTL